MLFGALSYFAALGMSEIVRRGGNGWWGWCAVACYTIAILCFYESWYDWYYEVPATPTPNDLPLIPQEPW